MSVTRISRTNLLYLSGGLILAAMMGFSVGEAILWGALWIWNRDFRFALGERYVKWVMAGLGAAAVFQYFGGFLANLPSGFTAGALVALGVWAGIGRRGRGRQAQY